MSLRYLTAGAALASLALASPIPAPVSAQTAPSAAGEDCGSRLSPAVLSRWQETGGAHGQLGCPAGPESAAAKSPAGVAAVEADFASGMILRHVDGPRAGQSFVVVGCPYRLYFQYGGPSGWLGLPLGDAVNTADGQTQAFEGGVITFERALNYCAAERTAEIAQAVPTPAADAATSPLDAFFDPARGDHLSAAAANTVRVAEQAHYARQAAQARVFVEQQPGTAPLKLLYNESLGQHVSVATAQGESAALAQGFEFEGAQGFVWTDPRPGARALRQFRDPTSGRYWLTASDEESAKAAAEGFAFIRVEGYAPGP